MAGGKGVPSLSESGSLREGIRPQGRDLAKLDDAEITEEDAARVAELIEQTNPLDR